MIVSRVCWEVMVPVGWMTATGRASCLQAQGSLRSWQGMPSKPVENAMYCRPPPADTGYQQISQGEHLHEFCYFLRECSSKVSSMSYCQALQATSWTLLTKTEPESSTHGTSCGRRCCCPLQTLHALPGDGGSGRSQRLTCGDSAACHRRRRVPGALGGLTEGLQVCKAAAASSEVRCHVTRLVLGLPLRLNYHGTCQVLRRRGLQKPTPGHAGWVEDAKDVPKHGSSRGTCFHACASLSISQCTSPAGCCLSVQRLVQYMAACPG